jgi:hypothetical protein
MEQSESRYGFIKASSARRLKLDRLGGVERLAVAVVPVEEVVLAEEVVPAEPAEEVVPVEVAAGQGRGPVRDVDKEARQRLLSRRQKLSQQSL